MGRLASPPIQCKLLRENDPKTTEILLFTVKPKFRRGQMQPLVAALEGNTCVTAFSIDSGVMLKAGRNEIDCLLQYLQNSKYLRQIDFNPADACGNVSAAPVPTPVLDSFIQAFANNGHLVRLVLYFFETRIDIDSFSRMLRMNPSLATLEMNLEVFEYCLQPELVAQAFVAGSTSIKDLLLHSTENDKVNVCVIRALHTFLYLTKFTFKLNGNEEDEVFDALQFYLSQTNVLQHLELRAECVLYKYETTCLMSGLAVNTSVVELTLSCCAFNEDARQCLEAQFRHCNIQKLTMASDSDFDRVVSIGETIGRMLIGSPLQALCVDLWNNFEPWDFAGFCNVLAANAQFIKLKRLHVTDMERVCRRAFLDCLPALVTLQDVEFDVEFEGCSTVKPWSMRSDKMEVCTI